MRADALLAGLLALIASGPARADLPLAGWPQGRRDAARTGRSDEPVLSSGRVRFVVRTGAPLSGEPVVSGCTLAVMSEDGRTHAFNARNGVTSWTHDPAHAVELTGVGSALALDESGVLFAGVPADPVIARAASSIQTYFTAIESYSIDYGEYPPGADLVAELTPTYVRSLPSNAFTGGAASGSDTPSPGSFRYERPIVSEFYLGFWNDDGGLFAFQTSCSPNTAFLGLAPGWPVSAETGGAPLAIDASTGAELWRRDDISAPGTVVQPAIGASGVTWSAIESSMPFLDSRFGSWWWGWVWGGGGGVGGRVWGSSDGTFGREGGSARTTAMDGTLLWKEATWWGQARGGPAMDAAGNTWQARGPARWGGLALSIARTFSSAVEAYFTDNGRYPPTGDLEALLVPTYLSCMPSTLDGDSDMTWSATWSPGDYDYESVPDGAAYRVAIWDDRGGIQAEVEDGAVTIDSGDGPPRVVALTAAGAARWQAPVGLESQDVTPAVLRGDGSIVLATSGGRLIALNGATGAEIWNVDAGDTLSLAPALMPDDGIVAVTAGGTVLAFAPDGSERWRTWIGATVDAAPTTTSDGATYIADMDGELHALAIDGSFLWEAYLGGPYRASLTTPAIAAGGWLYVGRSDGAILAVVPQDTAGRPASPFPLLATGLKSTSSVEWTWAGVPAPQVPGAHWHLRRWRGSLLGPGEDILAHPFAADTYLDNTATGSLIFYDLHATDCGENESG